MRKYLLTSFLIFSLFLSLLNTAYGRTVYFEDNFEVEAETSAKWTECPDLYANAIRRDNNYVYSGNWAINTTGNMGVGSLFQDPLYYNISLDTSNGGYQLGIHILGQVRTSLTRPYAMFGLQDPSQSLYGYCSTHAGGYQNRQDVVFWVGYDGSISDDYYVYQTADDWPTFQVTDVGIVNGSWISFYVMIGQYNSTHDRYRGYLGGNIIFDFFYADPVGSLFTVLIYPNYQTYDWSYYDYFYVWDWDNAGTDYDTEYFGNDGSSANTNSSSGWDFDLPSTYFVRSMVQVQGGSSNVLLKSGYVVLGDVYYGTMMLGVYMSPSDLGCLGRAVSSDCPLFLVASYSWLNPSAGTYGITDIDLSVTVGQTVAVAVSGTEDNLVINDTSVGTSVLYNASGRLPSSITSYGVVDSASAVGLYGVLVYLSDDYSGLDDDSTSFLDDLTGALSGSSSSTSGVLGVLVLLRDASGFGQVGGGIMIWALFCILGVIGIFVYTADLQGGKGSSVPPVVYTIVVLAITFGFSAVGFVPYWTVFVIMMVVALSAAPLFVGRR